jgi:hypothetical protein
MTVPVLSQNGLIELIIANGWEVITTVYWNNHDRLIVGKNGEIRTIQCQKKYFFFTIVKICEHLEFDPPEEFIHAHFRHMKYDERPCYCKTGVPFKDCHGKID